MQPENLAFLPVVNDDMVPTLTVGTLALIDTGQTDTSPEGLWAVGIRGGYCFARIQHPSPDIMLLTGDNPDHPAQVFKGDDLAALRVLGRVVWIVSQP